MRIEIKGQAKAEFAPVRTAYEQLWQGIEVGSSLCIYHRGEKVVDLWGGFTDRDMSTNWEADTLVNVYSTSKGLAALAIAILHGEGRIDYDEKVVVYWPEFGAEGKEHITVAQLLSHQAGLCGVDARLSVKDLYDWRKMINLLAAQKPLWPLGTGAGYHAVTWGYFPGELIRRLCGKTLGQYLQEKVTIPLNADFYIGLSESEFSRCAALIGPNHARPEANSFKNDQESKGRRSPGKSTISPKFYAEALLNPTISPFKDACSREWRKAEIAASNGHASARGIARIYAALSLGGTLDGLEIVPNSSLKESLKVEVDGPEDMVLGGKLRRARGFMLNTDEAYGPNPSSFGHAGAGGSLGFADMDAGIGFGYAMNQMQNDSTSIPRSKRLLKALYQCISQI
jgi:CubicO group peptidase (beta-lactamase class C family)